MNVAELLVRCLENEGVRYVFGVPGEENEDLLFALEGSPIRFVPTRHEQGAAFIANVWGRITGKAGVCLSTLGPGATNLITGVADANLDKAPLVALTGQGGLTRLHHESHQYLDVVSLFRPITKWNAAISAPEVVPEIVRKAFKRAEAEKPGATHVELSEDLAAADAPEGAAPLAAHDVRRPGPDYKALERTCELLERARRPLIIAGNGAIRKLASKHLTALVDRHDIPVVSTFMGKGAVSDRHPRSLHALGLGFRDLVMDAVDRADLILTVGYDIAEVPPETWNPDGARTIVHVDFEPAEVYTHYAPAVEVVSDISAVLWELNRRLADAEPGFEAGWYLDVQQRIREDIASYRLEEGDAFTVPGAVSLIRDHLPDHGLLVSDVGSHKMWIARNFPTCEPGGCIISNGLASMGIALPGGIAAALVDPERPVVAAMGDGGFLMNSQELETARRLGVAFTVVIFNDDDYGLISWKQRDHRGRSVGTRIGNPDFVRYAESFGIRGVRPRTVAELDGALGDAIGSGDLTVVEVPVDPSVNDRLRSRLDAFWTQRREDP